MEAEDLTTTALPSCHETPLADARGPTLDRRARWGWWGSVLILILACGVLDWATGTEVSVFMVYMLPVALATRTLGVGAGVWAAVIGGIVWAVADVAAGHVYTHGWILWVNTANRVVTFLLAALSVHLLWTVRKSAWWRWAAGRSPLVHCHACEQVRGPDGQWRSAMQHLELLRGEPAQPKVCPDCARRRYAWVGYREPGADLVAAPDAADAVARSA